MRTVYRQNPLVPMRLYRNVTPEYQALLASVHQDNSGTGIMIPHRFVMQYAGTRRIIDLQCAGAADTGVYVSLDAMVCIVLLSVAGALLLAACIYRSFCAPASTSVHPGTAGVEARPLLLYV